MGVGMPIEKIDNTKFFMTNTQSVQSKQTEPTPAVQDKEKSDEGGILNAWQLTNKFESFKKLGKQSGILFYIPAWCTSKIDPTTGFVNLLNIKYESVEKSKKFFKEFDDIRYNKNENYIEFCVDYSKLCPGKSYGKRKDWTICTYGDRVESFINIEKNSNWDCRKINLIDEYKKLLAEYTIDINNLKEEIFNENSKEFWVHFIKLFKLTCQIRNSIPNTIEDYLISPVKNAKGYFYDSRSAEEKLPQDADANGAYNIARKGLMCVEQIRNADEDKINKISYKITNENWLKYVQEKDC